MKKTATILAIAAAGISSALADVPPPPGGGEPVPEAVSTVGILALGLVAVAAGRRFFRK